MLLAQVLSHFYMVCCLRRFLYQICLFRNCRLESVVTGRFCYSVHLVTITYDYNKLWSSTVSFLLLNLPLMSFSSLPCSFYLSLDVVVLLLCCMPANWFLCWVHWYSLCIGCIIAFITHQSEAGFYWLDICASSLCALWIWAKPLPGLNCVWHN